MMSPDAIAAMAMMKRPPLEIRNSAEVMKWRLKQAVYLTMQSMMDEMMSPIKKRGGHW